MNMNEEFLKYVWQSRSLPDRLILVNREELQIADPGEVNHDSGPDFFNSRLRINDVLWAGNVEIHVRSSDWFRHQHHQDPAYDNILLHVVHEYDQPVHRTSGEEIPCLELHQLINPRMWTMYEYLLRNRNQISCESMIHLFPLSKLKLYCAELAKLRFIRKAGQLVKLAENIGHDSAQLLFISLARSFGMNTNALPFELLAKSIPFNTLLRHSDDLRELEAILFGQAGLLSAEISDHYYQQLKQDYEFYAKKYELHPIDPKIWKFFRIRPGNFPTIRIAQLAGLLHYQPDIFSRVTGKDSTGSFPDRLKISVSAYWNDHYIFGKFSKKVANHHSREILSSLALNCFVPFKIYYSDLINDKSITAEIMDWLSSYPPEDNKITRPFEQLGIRPENAVQSQGLIELRTRYCSNKRCLDCEVGRFLLDKH